MSKDLDQPCAVAYAIARHGPMRVAQGDLISRCLGLYGEWAWLETLFILRVAALSGCERIVDIGANIGSLSLAFANHFHGEVHAIEGSASNHAILLENARLAGFQNLQVFRRMIPGINPGQDRRGIAQEQVIAQDIQASNRGAYALDVTPAEFEGAGLFDPAEHGQLNYVAKIDVEVSSLAALQLLYSAERKPLACFIEADEAMASLAKVNAIAQGQCTVPLAFPAFNPANSKGAPNVLFGNACEHSILICSPQLLAALESHLNHRFRTDQVNAITAAMAERLGEGLEPRVIAVQAEASPATGDDVLQLPIPSRRADRRLIPVLRRLKRRILRV